MLSEKENYLRCLRGEVPEWIPIHGMSCGEQYDFAGQPHNFRFEPRLTTPHRYRGGGLDMWGVEHTTTPESMGGLQPRCDYHILDDIRKWRDVIKAPDISNIDWEKMCRDDFKFHGLNFEHKDTAIAFSTDMSFFMMLVEFMGYTEGLLAMYEEPDEVMALFDYMCDFYCEDCEKCIDIVKPDIWHMGDDTCAQQAPMMSEEMFKRMLIPFYDRQIKIGRDRGLPISMHVCGKCESFLDDLVDIGVSIWEPAQTMNDLAGIKAKYGNKLVIVGGWDGRGSLLGKDVGYDEIYEYTKKTFDTLAPGGGYCFMGGFMGLNDGGISEQKNKWLTSIYEGLKYTYYK